MVEHAGWKNTKNIGWLGLTGWLKAENTSHKKMVTENASWQNNKKRKKPKKTLAGALLVRASHASTSWSFKHTSSHAPTHWSCELGWKNPKNVGWSFARGSFSSGSFTHTHYWSKVGPHIALPSLFPLLKVLATQAPTTSSTHLKPR